VFRALLFWHCSILVVVRGGQIEVHEAEKGPVEFCMSPDGRRTSDIDPPGREVECMQKLLDMSFPLVLSK
jgi:putative hemolysin